MMAEPAGLAVVTVIQYLALGIGAGLGAGFGIRGVMGRAAESPAPYDSHSTTPRVAQTLGALFVASLAVGIVGFFCGATSGVLLLAPLQAVSIFRGAVGLVLANLITGLIAGALAGSLVELLAARLLWPREKVPSLMLRGAVIGGGVGAIAGWMVARVESYPLGGTLLTAISVGALAALVSGLLPAARPRAQR